MGVLVALTVGFGTSAESLDAHVIAGHEFAAVDNDVVVAVMSTDEYNALDIDGLEADLDVISSVENITKFYILVNDENVAYLFDTTAEPSSLTLTTEEESNSVAQTGLEEIPNDSEIAEPIRSGMYKVGQDIPSGDYILFGNSDFSYFTLYKDSTGGLDSTLGIEFIKGHLYITLEEGDYFELTKAEAYPANASPSTAPIGNPTSGMYLVGKDIPPGEYVVSGDSNLSYFTVYADVTYKGFDGIHTIEFIDGNKYITLFEGQYISLNDAELLLD